jgi:uridine kinase
MDTNEKESNEIVLPVSKDEIGTPRTIEEELRDANATIEQYKSNDRAHWYMHIKVHSIMADTSLTWQTKGKMALKIYDELKKSIEPKTETQVAK